MRKKEKIRKCNEDLAQVQQDRSAAGSVSPSVMGRAASDGTDDDTGTESFDETVDESEIGSDFEVVASDDDDDEVMITISEGSLLSDDSEDSDDFERPVKRRKKVTWAQHKKYRYT